MTIDAMPVMTSRIVPLSARIMLKSHGISYITPSRTQYLLLFLSPMYTNPNPFKNGIMEMITHHDFLIFSTIFIINPVSISI
ncbi:MAG: hypothetical protein Q4Q37_01010 [Methanobrevibacter sp.]|nr:hypothetical protein [Methanobrevibacter sp.]